MGLKQEVKDELILLGEAGQIIYAYFQQIFLNVLTEKTLLPTIVVGYELDVIFEDNKEVSFPEEFHELLKEYKDMLQPLLGKTENDKEIQDLLEKLNIEFTSLYLSGINNVEVSASSYLSPTKLIKGDECDAVKEIYYKRGLDLSEYKNYPEDHVAIEMHYASKLCELCGNIFQHSYNYQPIQFKQLLEEMIDFFENHILNWFPFFMEKTVNKSNELNSRFYAINSLIFYEYIKYDLQVLKKSYEIIKKLK